MYFIELFLVSVGGSGVGTYNAVHGWSYLILMRMLVGEHGYYPQLEESQAQDNYLCKVN